MQERGGEKSVANVAIDDERQFVPMHADRGDAAQGICADSESDQMSSISEGKGPSIHLPSPPPSQ